MKKRAAFSLLGLGLAGVGAAGGLTALGNYLYDQAMLPRVRDPERMDEFPAQAEGRLWAREGRGFRPVTIQAVDGLALWAAHVPALGDSHLWAICLHGYYDTHESMGAIARRYHEDGWNVLLPDQRGHGNSEGGYVGWGYDERLDLLGWVNFITRRDPDAEIVLHGVSMGAATVLMAAGGALPRQVKAAVSDCAYTSIEEEMRHVLLQGYHSRVPSSLPLPAGVLFALLRRATLRRAGFDLRDVRPIDAVTESRTPTLFIHGSNDEFVPAAMMGRLYQAARCPKSFLWMPGAAHAQSIGADPDLYWTTVITFLREYFNELKESF